MAYIKWLIIFVWLPTLVLWALHFRLLWKYKKTVIFCAFWALVFSIPWDRWAVGTKIWFFPKDTNVGLWFGNLPLEEYFFMIFVTIEISTLTLLTRHYLRLWDKYKEQRRAVR